MSTRIYCTYLTIYSGNKLPPFYIGYSYTDKIIYKNYHGTVTSNKYKTIWESELNSFPHLFKTIILKTFSDKQDAKQHEEYLQKQLNVHKNILFINQTVNYKMFGSIGNHSDKTKQKISLANKGKTRTNEVKAKLSKAKKGKRLSEESRRKKTETMRQNGFVPWNKGKKIKLTDEQKYERYNHRKGKPIAAQIIGTEYVTDSLWINNGIVNKRIKKDSILPEGFVLGRLFQNIPKPMLNKKWYNNGITQQMFKLDEVPDGWVTGRLPPSKETREKMRKSAKNRNK